MNEVNQLFQQWARLGSAALVAKVEANLPDYSTERLIAESTAFCRDSGRLTWVVLSWLVRNIEQVKVKALLEETRQHGDLTVLGVLCDAARQRCPHPSFDRLIAACPKAATLEPFFRRVARSPLALAETRANPLEIFRRWNYLCNELRYL